MPGNGRGVGGPSRQHRLIVVSIVSPARRYRWQRARHLACALYLLLPDTAVLTRFLDKAEREAAPPFTLVHMSDNGESFAYLGRPGWRLVRSGSIQMFQTASGRSIKFYEFPQHYSVWRYEGVK